MEMITVFIKIIFLYLLIIVSYYLMGKRTLNELSIMDLILFLMLSNIITISIPNNKNTFVYISLITAFLIVIQVIMSYLLVKVPIIKYMFQSKPSIIINRGKLDFKEMIKRRYNLDELLRHLQMKSIKNIEDVEYAVLENNGALSIFNYKKTCKDTDLPLPLILNGQIQYVTLRLLHKDDEWMSKMIAKENVPLNNIFYAFYKQGRIFIIKND